MSKTKDDRIKQLVLELLDLGARVRILERGRLSRLRPQHRSLPTSTISGGACLSTRAQGS